MQGTLEDVCILSIPGNPPLFKTGVICRKPLLTITRSLPTQLRPTLGSRRSVLSNPFTELETPLCLERGGPTVLSPASSRVSDN